MCTVILTRRDDPAKAVIHSGIAKVCGGFAQAGGLCWCVELPGGAVQYYPVKEWHIDLDTES